MKAFYAKAVLVVLAACAILTARADSRERIRQAAIQQGLTFTTNNSLVFFDNGAAKFRDLFAAVRQAKSSIHMEYFNFRDDSIANALFDLLAQKVQQGVEVRLLYDDFGNASNNQPIRRKRLKEIRATGIQIYNFDPIRFPWVNHIIPRDHRKIVIIDGKTAYSGGMNVADYYIHGKEELGGWHDIHYRMEGDIVGQYQEIFLRAWKKETGEDISGAKYYPGESYPWNALTGLDSDSDSSQGQKTIAVVNREPRTSPAVIRNIFLSAINSAEHSLQIINPYFTLSRPIRRALKAAVARGVKVEIMVSEKSDIPITPRIVDARAREMQQAGALVYYYQGGFHHSKIMMVDSAYCYVGSANLDARSLKCDYEVNALVLDAEATRHLQRIFARDRDNHSQPLTDSYWRAKKRSHKLQAKLYKLLTPFV